METSTFEAFVEGEWRSMLSVWIENDPENCITYTIKNNEIVKFEQDTFKQ